MHKEFVRIDRALNNVFGQSIGARNEDDVTEAGCRIESEHHLLVAWSERVIFMTPTDSVTL
jgi:hypothetical protein